MDVKPLAWLAGLLLSAPVLADSLSQDYRAIERNQLQLEQEFRDQAAQDRHREVMQRLERLERSMAPTQGVPSASEPTGYYPELMKQHCMAYPGAEGC